MTLEKLKHYEEIHKTKGLNIKPFWHRDEKSIDLTNLADNVTPLKLNDLTIIEIEMEKLLNVLDTDEADRIKKKNIFTYYYEDKIVEILDLWTKNIKLIPPIAIIYDEIYFKTFPNDFPVINNNIIRIRDGNHRLSTAYFLGSKTIPLLVLKIQNTTVLNLLSK